jgi:arylsulfatase A-like enzyme
MIFNDIYLPPEELTMAEIFKEAGFRTAYLGKWHLDGHGRLNNVEPDRRQGFDYWKALECSHDYNQMPYYEGDQTDMKYWEGYSPHAIVQDAMGYLDRHAADADPFLLFVSLATPHFPHHSAPEDYKAMYPLEKIQLRPNVPEELHEKVLPELQGYYAHCTATDRVIGDLVAHMKEGGLMENTVLVFTSDHGEMMGSHGRLPFRKQLAWDESLHVPFLISYPGIEQKGGSVLQAPLTTPDILPSLLGLCGLDIPETVEGENLAELILEPDPEADRDVLFMNVTPFDVNWNDPSFRGIRTSRYTYTVSPEGPAILFDHLEDPYQFNNLADSPDYAGLEAQLRESLFLKLRDIGEEEMRPREYYIGKWNYEIENNNINYWSFNEGEGKVQGPGKYTGLN